MAESLVKVSVAPAVTVAEGAVPRPMVVAVTETTLLGVVVSRSKPYALMPTVTPAVIGLVVQVRESTDVVPVQPVRLTIGLFSNAPYPWATVGGPAAHAASGEKTIAVPATPSTARTARNSFETDDIPKDRR